MFLNYQQVAVRSKRKHMLIIFWRFRETRRKRLSCWFMFRLCLLRRKEVFRWAMCWVCFRSKMDYKLYKALSRTLIQLSGDMSTRMYAYPASSLPLLQSSYSPWKASNIVYRLILFFSIQFRDFLSKVLSLFSVYPRQVVPKQSISYR